MSIINQLPHTARPLVPSIVATATFGTPTIGIYDFTGPNDDLPVFVAKANRAYLIERILWSGSIPSADWSASIFGTPPNISLYYKNAGQNVVFDPYPYPLSIFSQGSDFVGWFLNQKEDQQIFAKVNGALNQIANTVGMLTIEAVVSFGVYEIGDLTTTRAYLDRISDQSGQQIRGRIA